MTQTVGQRIREIAIAKAQQAGLAEPTALEIAASIGVHYESLRKWTTSATAPNRKRAEKIAALLGVPVAEFMLGMEPADDDEGPDVPPPTYSARALRVAAIYDQVSPKDRRHIDAAADAAASPDDPPGTMGSDDVPLPGPTPAPVRPN